jgi:hypothetical protein
VRVRAQLVWDGTNVGKPQAVPGTKVPTGYSPPITGNFANSPGFDTLVAANPPLDFEFKAGDTLTVQFTVKTNRGGFPVQIDKAAIDQLFSVYSGSGSTPEVVSLGSDYSGFWFNDGRSLRITIVNAAGSSPLKVDELRLVTNTPLIKNQEQTSDSIYSLYSPFATGVGVVWCRVLSCHVLE